ncbi:hypothetical protein CHLRE_16g670650v5 [Chlamydomonas reinhardtii]|uniref:Uncharacterized protein n=1 Tax=Chlamydomonas reinhardtii TaxID=3055 RepID=A0A2K3CU89_CHLRE|nr:uncharacterized protein CHLRE_16g670650v5 [Chlamydomonas reinhardtii]PNW71846.1 hypothetical protein CHLRE_16g670650v5 [Chlamydomonas reinhardtii]
MESAPRWRPPRPLPGVGVNGAVPESGTFSCRHAGCWVPPPALALLAGLALGCAVARFPLCAAAGGRPLAGAAWTSKDGRAGAPEGLGGVDCCHRSSREVGQVQAKVYCQGADPVSSQREVAPRLRRLEVEEAARNYA